jgi:hypothetical protein
VVQRIAATGEDRFGRSADDRPAIAIVAGLDASHRIGRDVALGLVQRLLDAPEELLAERTVYVLASANPDGFAVAAGDRRPASGSGRAPRSGDADRDGRVDEDPADDLNGDGLITMMRVANPTGRFGLSAEWVIDEHDSRVLRKPAVDAGEIATHALVVEGTDNDGDGRLNEDGYAGSGGGGVDLDRNFPSLWPELEDGAGLYPSSEPETRAIIEWLQSRPNIAAVVVFGSGDNLANVPGTKQFDESGRMPKGLEADDLTVFKRVAEAYAEATGIKKAGKPEVEGSLTAWAYNDLGVWSFRSTVWTRPEPEQSKDDESAAEESSPADAEPAEPTTDDERQRLTDLGVEAVIIDFLLASDEERAAMTADFESGSPEEQQAVMAALAKAPPEIQARVTAIAQTGTDPAAGDRQADAVEGDTEPATTTPGKPKESEDTRWLAYFAEQGHDDAFVTWQTIEHPQLGEVEVGGFVPGVRTNPPGSAISDLVDGQHGFITALLGMLPDLDVHKPEVERVGDSIWRIRLHVANPGDLPTFNAMAEKARRLAPTVAVLQIDDAAIITGRKSQPMGPVAGGDRGHAEWTVVAAAGKDIEIQVRSARFGDRGVSVTLEETN